MPLGLSPHDCLEQFAWDSRRHYCGKHPPDDALSTSSGTWNDPIVALFTSTSAVCVTGLGLSIPAPIFFLGTIFVVTLFRLGDWLYDSNHLSPAATRCQILPTIKLPFNKLWTELALIAPS